VWQTGGLQRSERPEIALLAETPSKTTYNHVTGEEEEETEYELKGLKLFVKRGDQNFSGGMIGHIKLLSDKNTQVQRLLFRREPLWQVMMNVRLSTHVRCTYDEGEKILRLILKETVDKKDVPPEQRPQELVVYAFKPGRVPKDEFNEFVQALTSNPHLSKQPAA